MRVGVWKQKKSPKCLLHTLCVCFQLVLQAALSFWNLNRRTGYCPMRIQWQGNVMRGYAYNKTLGCKRSLLILQVYGWFGWKRYFGLLNCICIELMLFSEIPSLYSHLLMWTWIISVNSVKCEIKINPSAFPSAEVWKQFFNGFGHFSTMTLGF